MMDHSQFDDKLRQIWQNQPIVTRSNPEVLMEMIQTKATKFHRTIFWRNIREVVVAAVLVPFALWSASAASSPLIKASSYMLAAACVWIVFYIWLRHRGSKAPDPTSDFDTYRHQILASFDEQIVLLKNVKYWYLLPLYVAPSTFFAGHALSAAGRWFDWIPFFVLTASFVFIWILNEVYGVREIRKQRSAVEALLADCVPQ